MRGPLSGIKVLDLADEKGSFTSKLLADLGAHVIKIERPGGDSSQRIGPFLENLPHQERSLSFFYKNINKFGITLNLEREEGRGIFLRLVKKSDVLVETFPPDYLKRLGLGYEVLSKTNPKIIMVSITGFGQFGPRSMFKSCDIVSSAFGGQMYVSGEASSPPLKPFGEQSYYTASLFAAIGILLAIRKKNQTKKGDHIDISLQESVVSTLEHVLVQYFYEGIVAKRRGNIHWNNSFTILRCQDGWILISLSHQWETLVEWMDSEGMAEDLKDKKYLDEQYRQKDISHILEVIENWTMKHKVDELFQLAQLMRLPWSPIYSPKEVIDSPQLKDRNFFIEVKHPEIRTSLKYPGIPYRLSPFIFRYFKRAPLIGEDNNKIYKEELSLTNEDLERLSSSGVI